MIGKPRELNIVGLPCSLRRESFNRRLLLAAAECAPLGVRIELFNETGAGRVAPAAGRRRRLRHARAGTICQRCADHARRARTDGR